LTTDPLSYLKTILLHINKALATLHFIIAVLNLTDAYNEYGVIQ